MNQWLQQSIEYANQRSYLDDLFRVYPTIPDGIREVDQALWREVEQSFELQDNEALVRAMLKMKLFHSITTTYRDAHIMSALVLRNFLYSL
ncbi:hypothetical protein [Porphyromonas sp. COT-239 OH1446]|uniref:hypothetical protein n=1 Tax=Porphyromonas sp. COT-239 OH1446 TaxID=1515613 RepID=UPI00068A86A5|nr:hypothetical protein [Porphyromonas sp. COT-239 OH1446]